MNRLFRIAALGMLLALVAPAGHAAGTLAPVQVFTDAVDDGNTTFLTWQDLVAGFIAETDTDIAFTWKVADIPDALANGVPELANYYWEFTLSTPALPDGARFSVRARGTRNGTVGDLYGEPCTQNGTLISCTRISSAVVNVSVDPIANTVTASVRRKDLKANNIQLAIDGAVLEEANLFQGIASFTTASNVLTPGATGDQADMDDSYVLGSPRV